MVIETWIKNIYGAISTVAPVNIYMIHMTPCIIIHNYLIVCHNLNKDKIKLTRETEDCRYFPNIIGIIEPC